MLWSFLLLWEERWCHIWSSYSLIPSSSYITMAAYNTCYDMFMYEVVMSGLCRWISQYCSLYLRRRLCHIHKQSSQDSLQVHLWPELCMRTPRWGRWWFQKGSQNTCGSAIDLTVLSVSLWTRRYTAQRTRGSLTCWDVQVSAHRLQANVQHHYDQNGGVYEQH